MYNSEVETPRNDGSVGVYLKYTPDSGFEAVSTQKSGLFINGDVKDMEFITLNNDDYINVQDILYLVNLILSNEFTLIADLNNDNQLNIIDIMLLIDEILN